jgi:hypothetical protein
MKIWNFANFFTEDVKKNHIFPQFFRYKKKKKKKKKVLCFGWGMCWGGGGGGGGGGGEGVQTNFPGLYLWLLGIQIMACRI